jgi:hypothetical protein
MIRRFAFLSIFTPLFILPTEAEIVVTDDIDTLEAILRNTDENVVIIFDCDNTLIRPEDQILRPGSANTLSNLMKQTAKSKEARKELEGIEWETAQKRLVDKRLPDIVRALQIAGKNVCVMTAMENERLGNVWSIDIRNNELRDFGFDFSRSCRWVCGEGYLGKKLIYFRKGIICSGSHSKGLAVEMLIKKLWKKPPTIVFVDDSRKHVDDVSRAASGLGIRFVGVHWTAAREPIPGEVKFSMAIARKQIEVLMERKTWISDKEAAVELSKAAKVRRRAGGKLHRAA